MKRASTSFPVPDSPCRNTVVSVQATWVAFLNTCSNSGDCPTTRRGPDCASRFSVRLRTIAEGIAEIAMLGLFKIAGQLQSIFCRPWLNHSPLRPSTRGCTLDSCEGQCDLRFRSGAGSEWRHDRREPHP